MIDKTVSLSVGYKCIRLTSEEIMTLGEDLRNYPEPYFRIRYSSLLLSNRGYDIQSTSTLYQTRVNTVGK